MNIGFYNILENKEDIEKFPLKYRFTEEKYNKISEIHLNQIIPLNKEGAKFIWNYTKEIGLHDNRPFKVGLFKTIDKIECSMSEKEIKKWLYQRGIEFQKNVYLLWQSDIALIVPWKILIKYFDDFFYEGSDDLTVFDESMTWTLLFYHNGEIYFGTKDEFEIKKNIEDEEFIW